MKIIPKYENESAEFAEVMEILNSARSPKIRIYEKFLSIYGGGLVFPNTISIPDGFRYSLDFSESAEPSHFKKMSAQSLLQPQRILDERKGRIDGVADSENFLVIARSDTVADFHISLREEDAGTIYYWEPYGDGVNFIHQPIAGDFIEFLEMRYFDPDMGMSLPWRNMRSVDEAPAIDLDLNALR